MRLVDVGVLADSKIVGATHFIYSSQQAAEKSLNVHKVVICKSSCVVCEMQIRPVFFGWGKTVGGLRKTRLRGLRRNKQLMCLAGLAYKLVRSVECVRPRNTRNVLQSCIKP